MPIVAFRTAIILYLEVGVSLCYCHSNWLKELMMVDIYKYSTGLGRKQFAGKFERHKLPMIILFIYGSYMGHKERYWNSSVLLEFLERGEVLAVCKDYSVYAESNYIAWSGPTKEFLDEVVSQKHTQWHLAALKVLELKKAQKYPSLFTALRSLGFSDIEKLAPIEIPRKDTTRKKGLGRYDPREDERQPFLLPDP